MGYTATDIIDGMPFGMHAALAEANGSPRLLASASAARTAS
jgi:hypothetical protein